MNRKPDELTDWPRRLAASIGERVRELRKTQGLSAQELADRTTTLGHEVKRSVISDMEIGRRPTVALPDIFVLARALSVPPIALIAPAASGSAIEVLAGDAVDTWAAVDWINGAGARLNSPRTWIASHEDVEASEAIWHHVGDPYFVKHLYDVAVARWLDAIKSAATEEPNTDAHKYATQLVHTERRRVRELRDELGAKNLQLPEMPLWLDSQNG